MSDGAFISFPNLGIEKFKVDSVAFTLFGLEVRWYAIIICAGIISAFIYFLQRGKKNERIKEDDLLNATLFAVPLGVIGARFLYVITNLDNYDGFLEMINIREGGLAIYGAIIFGGATLLVYALIKRHNPLKYFDAICPGVMIAQAIGRWGNFMNGEAFGEGYGAEGFLLRMDVQRFKYENNLPSTDGYGIHITHPTFLYESLWNVLGFVIANLLYKNKKFDGRIFTFYVAWYGFGRAWIEFLRSDSLLVGGQKLMVWLGFITCAAAIGAHIYLYRRSNKELSEFTAMKKEEIKDDNT